MKLSRSILSFAACASLTLLPMAFGQAGKAEPKAKDDAPDFQPALKQLTDSIAATMELFTKAGQPDAERMKGFERNIASIQQALDATAENGDLDKLIQKAVTKNTEIMKRMETSSNAADTPAEQRETYAKYAIRMKAALAECANQRIALLRTRAGLDERKQSILKNKQFYVDAIAMQDMEMANTALANTVASMKMVNTAIDELGQNLKQTKSGGPAQR
ncbi:MAG: hypothetical protein ACOYMV_12560 [Verrucomicrobiia bacterium]